MCGTAEKLNLSFPSPSFASIPFLTFVFFIFFSYRTRGSFHAIRPCIRSSFGTLSLLSCLADNYYSVFLLVQHFYRVLRCWNERYLNDLHTRNICGVTLVTIRRPRLILSLRWNLSPEENNEHEPAGDAYSGWIFKFHFRAILLVLSWTNVHCSKKECLPKWETKSNQMLKRLMTPMAQTTMALRLRAIRDSVLKLLKTYHPISFQWKITNEGKNHTRSPQT